MNLGEILVKLWETSGLYGLFGKLPMWGRWIIYTGLTVFVIVITLNGGVHQEFIYFQF